jgi:endonuclease-8
MPEGDTVHRHARLLAGHLVGRPLRRLWLNDMGHVTELEGRDVASIEARGKHLLVHVAGGWSLRVHLGMKGRWRALPVATAVPPGSTVLIEAGDQAFACVRAYHAELARTHTLKRHPKLVRLGPDLLADAPRIREAAARARRPAFRHREIGDLLLDQRVASGVGNVYKSEVLFRCRIHPRTTVGRIPLDGLEKLFQEAAVLMQFNLATIRRTTVPLKRRPDPNSPRLWVYGRAGEACLACRSVIERIVQGDLARSTYFCPECQSSSVDLEEIEGSERCKRPQHGKRREPSEGARPDRQE